MRVSSWLAWFLLALFVALPALAAERRVVLLIPRELPDEPWPEGTQAVIAELTASDYQVLVQSSGAIDLDALSAELEAKLSDESTAGAVAIVRRGTTGVAYVRTRRVNTLVEIDAEVTQGAVGQGALALRVAELLRARDLPIPERPKRPGPEPETPPAPRPLARRKPAPPASEPETSPALIWLGPGLSFTSEVGTPLTSLDLGAELAVWRPLSVEPGLALSLSPLHLERAPGRVSLSARQFTLHLALAVWNGETASLHLGAGGGLIWVEESAEARAGFVGSSDSVMVGVLSGRVRGAIHAGRLSVVLVLEPGTMIPELSVQSDRTEIARLGRPWIRVSAGVGFSL